MQSWKMSRRTVRLAIVMLALVSSLALFGCSDDDDDAGLGPVNVGTRPTDLTRATAPMLNGEKFDFPSGEPFHPALEGDPTSVAFRDLSATTGLGAATISSGNSSVDAVVSVASLTFTWVGIFPSNLGRVTINPVQFQVFADGVVPGGGEVAGILRLIFFAADGTRVVAEVSVRVNVDDAGILFVNGINTGIDVTVTGLTGSGN